MQITMPKQHKMEGLAYTKLQNFSLEGDGNASSLTEIAPENTDGGALFVLESKGTWKHAGFHLTTSIASPALLSLPFALRDLGWVAGILALVICAGVSFYAYTIISQVLEYADHQGHRFLRFRDLGRYIFGYWGYYAIAIIQIVVCLGAVIGSGIIGGQSMKVITRLKPLSYY